MVDNIHKLVIHLDPAKDPTPIIKENPSDKSRRLDVVISHIKAYRLSDNNKENFLENGFVNMEKVLRTFRKNSTNHSTTPSIIGDLC